VDGSTNRLKVTMNHGLEPRALVLLI
jgi:hypothetical protein